MKIVDIILTPTNRNYDKETKTFTVSEVGIAFSMTYKLINPNTDGSRIFELSHSTGGEFEPDTRWIYKSDDGLTLEVCNDPDISKRRGDSYLKNKTLNLG